MSSNQTKYIDDSQRLTQTYFILVALNFILVKKHHDNSNFLS